PKIYNTVEQLPVEILASIGLQQDYRQIDNFLHVATDIFMQFGYLISDEIKNTYSINDKTKDIINKDIKNNFWKTKLFQDFNITRSESKLLSLDWINKDMKHQYISNAYGTDSYRWDQIQSIIIPQPKNYSTIYNDAKYGNF